MAKRIVKYGLKDVVLEKAKKMCGKNFEDQECPEFEEIKGKLEELEKTMARIRKYIGEKEKFPLKEGEKVIHPGTEIPTRILKKYKDLLNNERILTELTEIHIKQNINDPKAREWRKFVRGWGRRNLANILRAPDLILYDRKREAILYTKWVSFGNTLRMAGVVVGLQNRHYIFTVEPMSGDLGDRYVIIYDRKKDGVL